MERKKTVEEQFRTLGDPVPAQRIKANSVPAPEPTIRSMDWKPPLGHWNPDLHRRPNAWRRFWAWFLLGWRWERYPEIRRK